LARAVPTTASPPAAAAGGRLRGDGLAIALILSCYLLAAVAVTWRLWADPASHTVAGNPNDADFFAWFMRYDATALTHGRLPALVTAAMNAPQGINVMWNTSMLLPGVLLAPVTLLAGPQTSLTVLTTLGFAGSAASLFLVLRRWEVSIGSAALAGAVYGFSPALLQAAIGHYNLQFAVLPPLIIDLAVGLCVRSRSPVRDGILLGVLATAQLFTGEELLLLTGIAATVLIVVLALGRPREVPRRCRAAAAGFGAAAAVTLLLAGYALWVQFFGPLTQHGSSFTPDFFKNDVTGFITPSRYLLFHTAASAASAASYQGGAPEYLAYLGWPLIALLAVAAVVCCRQPAARATAVTLAVLALLSLGGHPLVGGTAQPGITLPWDWLESVPVIGTALPNRLSIVADGAAAALLAFSLDRARAWSAGARRAPARWAGAVATAVAVVACLPLLPLPLPAATPMPLPAGWSATFAALHLPQNARVLVVPVPTAMITAPLRWQADTGEPGSIIGGYFIGPAWNGQAYVEGNGVAATAQYLDWLWGGPSASVPSASQVRADLDTWRPAAVVAVAPLDSALGRYLQGLFGRPSLEFGSVLAWRR
jgi:Glycosyltransferase family 87